MTGDHLSDKSSFGLIFCWLALTSFITIPSLACEKNFVKPSSPTISSTTISAPIPLDKPAYIDVDAPMNPAVLAVINEFYNQLAGALQVTATRRPLDVMLYFSSNLPERSIERTLQSLMWTPYEITPRELNYFYLLLNKGLSPHIKDLAAYARPLDEIPFEEYTLPPSSFNLGALAFAEGVHNLYLLGLRVKLEKLGFKFTEVDLTTDPYQEFRRYERPGPRPKSSHVEDLRDPIPGIFEIEVPYGTIYELDWVKGIKITLSANEEVASPLPPAMIADFAAETTPHYWGLGLILREVQAFLKQYPFVGEVNLIITDLDLVAMANYQDYFTGKKVPRALPFSHNTLFLPNNIFISEKAAQEFLQQDWQRFKEEQLAIFSHYIRHDPISSSPDFPLLRSLQAEGLLPPVGK